MDADWVRWLIAIALGVIGYFFQRWITSLLERQKEKDEALQRELQRLSKNYHDLAAHCRKHGMLLARVCERLEIDQQDWEDKAD